MDLGFVGLGRMVLAYPGFAADVLAGRALARKSLCRTFSDCTSGPRQGLVSGCYPLDPFYVAHPHAARLREAKRPVAEAVRQELIAHLAADRARADVVQSTHTEIHRTAVRAARETALAMRANHEIGDDAFHQIEEELDWLEMADGSQMEPRAE